ncbi:MAG: hypothetical protein KGZ25_13190, partial [Planctomycetes bacterium]|nr:hypothetical protein [Planctomycetota bacterium]
RGDQSPPFVPRPAEIPPISRRVNAFTMDMLKQQSASNKAPSNLIISGESIFSSVALSYVTSGGKTRTELAEAFHFPSDDSRLLDDLSRLYKQQAAATKSRETTVDLASSLWLDEKYVKFQREYLRDVEQAFGAALQAVEYEHKEKVSQKINNWVSEQTQGRIREVVNPHDFRSGSGSVGPVKWVDSPVLTTVSAAYFKASWASQFEDGATKLRTFRMSEGEEIEANLMWQNSLFEYAENANVKFLKLPYIEGEFSMYVLLPRKVLSAERLAKLITPDSLNNLEGVARYHQVDVLMPKFKIRTQINVKKAALAMGVRAAFDKQQADFGRMIQNAKKWTVYIDDIFHHAWVAVDEEGTEAAATTTTVHFACSAPVEVPPANFHADHPFCFLIVHNRSASILFAGWISDPRELQQSGQRPVNIRESALQLGKSGAAECLAEVPMGGTSVFQGSFSDPTRLSITRCRREIIPAELASNVQSRFILSFPPQ